MPQNTKEYKCANCEAGLDLLSAKDGVIECPFCRSMFTLPKEQTKDEAKELLRIAKHELDNCAFDRAYSAYQAAAQSDPKEPEAYFGMALSRCKVQYLKDTVHNRLQPICHETSDEKFSDNTDYMKAFMLATGGQRSVYEKQAEDIDNVRTEFHRLAESGLDYDCFLCVKVSSDNGYTQDSVHAGKIYKFLKERGYSPFYSEEEIGGRTGAQYEAMILYALYTSECMIVVCGDENYLQTPWVKNEYTRFLKLINDEEKESDAITVAFMGKPIEKLAGKKGKIQGISLSAPDAYVKIENYVEAHTPESRARRERERANKEREADEIKKQIEAQKQAQRELEERLKNIQTAPVVGAASATVSSLLTRAKQFCDDGDFESAKDYYNKVLDVDPKNSDAWFGLFLAKYTKRSGDEVLKSVSFLFHSSIEGETNLNKALEYGKGTDCAATRFMAKFHSPELWWDKFLQGYKVRNESALIAKLDDDLLEKIPEDESYKLAKKYCDEKFAPRIKAFETAMDSPELHWRLSSAYLDLTDGNGKFLFDDVTPETVKGLRDDPHYKKAKVRARGELAAEISNFETALAKKAEKEIEILEVDVSANEKKIEQLTADLNKCNSTLKEEKFQKLRIKRSKIKPREAKSDTPRQKTLTVLLGISVAVGLIGFFGCFFVTCGGMGLISSFFGSLVAAGVAAVAVFGLLCLVVYLPVCIATKDKKPKTKNPFAELEDLEYKAKSFQRQISMHKDYISKDKGKIATYKNFINGANKK